MKKLTELLFSPLANVHGSILARAIEKLQTEGFGTGGNTPPDGVEEIECALLAFKCLRFLSIYGDSNPAQNPTIKVRNSLSTPS